MEEDAQAKQVFIREPGGRRPRGRPSKRWRDVVQADVSSAGLRNARRWNQMDGRRSGQAAVEKTRGSGQGSPRSGASEVTVRVFEFTNVYYMQIKFGYL